MQQEVYLQILQREFNKKKEKNPRYSLRIFVDTCFARAKKKKASAAEKLSQIAKYSNSVVVHQDPLNTIAAFIHIKG